MAGYEEVETGSGNFPDLSICNSGLRARRHDFVDENAPLLFSGRLRMRDLGKNRTDQQGHKSIHEA